MQQPEIRTVELTVQKGGVIIPLNIPALASLGSPTNINPNSVFLLIDCLIKCLLLRAPWALWWLACESLHCGPEVHTLHVCTPSPFLEIRSDSDAELQFATTCTQHPTCLILPSNYPTVALTRHHLIQSFHNIPLYTHATGSHNCITLPLSFTLYFTH